MNGRASRLLVVMDANYGSNLRSVPADVAIWVVLSSENEPVIRSLWHERATASAALGITAIDLKSGVPPEDQFLDELDMIDLHQGPFSTKAPYTTIEVVGASLNESIRVALAGLGFQRFNEIPGGFVATRTDFEARKIRD